jgi:hypothetical protein
MSGHDCLLCLMGHSRVSRLLTYLSLSLSLSLMSGIIRAHYPQRDGLDTSGEGADRLIPAPLRWAKRGVEKKEECVISNTFAWPPVIKRNPSLYDAAKGRKMSRPRLRAAERVKTFIHHQLPGRGFLGQSDAASQRSFYGAECGVDKGFSRFWLGPRKRSQKITARRAQKHSQKYREKRGRCVTYM